MKKYKTAIIVSAIIISLLSYGVYWLFFDWTRHKHELIAESTSPKGTYTIHAYVSDYGATTSYAVLGELIFNDSNKRSKKIYWKNKIDYAQIEWIDDDTVEINGITIHLPHEAYDFRKGIH